MGIPLIKKNQQFTYTDYLSWNNPTERWELINGNAYDMSPAPGTMHQNLSIELSGIIWNFLKGKSCKVFAAPFDVRLPDNPDDPDNEIDNVVQPDLAVICDESKLDEKGCKGAPDLIIEILSPGTAKKDYREKYNLYEIHGVREYWIVDPNGAVSVYNLQENKCYNDGVIYEKIGIVKSTIIIGLEVSLKDLFAFGIS